MNELEKIVMQTSEKLGVEFTFYPENIRPKNMPFCEKPFEGSCV